MDVNRVERKFFRQSTAHGVLNWFDFRMRRLGMLAFVLNRLTGIGLVFYLGLHLVVLSLLAGGESRWDEFVGLLRSPIFLVLDVILIAGALIHGLNGIRITLLGFGIGVQSERTVFIFLMVAALVLLVSAAVLIFIIA